MGLFLHESNGSGAEITFSHRRLRSSPHLLVANTIYKAHSTWLYLAPNHLI